ncbi:MAG: molybdenum cofactor guanylyltransferase [Bacteroidales bacterium]
MQKAYTLAILSGGKNQRFKGVSKALTTVGNQKVFQRIIAASDAKEVIIIANDPSEIDLFKKRYHLNVFSDNFISKGPLSGIHSALYHATYPQVLIMPSDLPLMNKPTVEYLYHHLNEQQDALIPVNNKHLHTVSAFYHKRTLPKAEKYLMDHEKCPLQEFIKTLQTHYLNIPDIPLYQQAFINMNTPQDYEYIMNILDTEPNHDNKL